jgi:hypothetical protein
MSVLEHEEAVQQLKVDRRNSEEVESDNRLSVHDSLGKDTPESRPIDCKPKANATVISLPRLGGLQHRYAWREAA